MSFLLVLLALIFTGTIPALVAWRRGIETGIYRP